MAALTAVAPVEPPELRLAGEPVVYADALALMEARAARIAGSAAPELVWFLEHPPVYTSGAHAEPVAGSGQLPFPLIRTRRGGQTTYHGPGQRIVYPLLDLRRRGLGVRAYVCLLEQWIIDALAEFGVDSGRRAGRTGVWCQGPDGLESKIAAIGIRVGHGVSQHGIAINVAPDLAAYDAIVPCGLVGFGVTSLAALGRPAGFDALDRALLDHWPAAFGARPTPGRLS